VPTRKREEATREYKEETLHILICQILWSLSSICCCIISQWHLHFINTTLSNKQTFQPANSRFNRNFAIFTNNAFQMGNRVKVEHRNDSEKFIVT
jgi:hypothetical protein